MAVGRSAASLGDLLSGDYDHHSLLGSDEGLSGFLAMERAFEQSEAKRQAARLEAERQAARLEAERQAMAATSRPRRERLSRARILDIQSECMADDLVDLDLEAMRNWSEAAVFAYFESGGEVFPDPDEEPVDHAAPASAAEASAPAPLTAEEAALLRAAEDGDEKAVRDLLSASGGPSVGVTDEVHGSFPLLLASQHGHTGTVRALLQHGARPSQSSRFRLSRTALMVAAAGGHEDTVRTLMQKGADADQWDANGDTALTFATSQGHEAAARVLREMRGLCL